MKSKQVYILLNLAIFCFCFSCSSTKKTVSEDVKVDAPGTGVLEPDTAIEPNPKEAPLPTSDLNGPIMTFDKTIVDFGKVKKGEKKTATYKFTNTGDEPLVIEIATTCHCTTLEYPQGKSIAPGEGGQFDIVFDSSEKDKSEKVDITIVLINTDKNGYPMIEELFFKFDLVVE